MYNESVKENQKRYGGKAPVVRISKKLSDTLKSKRFGNTIIESSDKIAEIAINSIGETL